MMKTLRKIQSMAVVLCCSATLWSCSDELEHGGTALSSDAIVFDGGLSEEWNTPDGTRSAAGRDSVMRSTQKFENAELYLHTTVTPGIEEDSSFAETRASAIDGTSITDYIFGVYAYAMRKESENGTFDPSKAAEYFLNQDVSYNEESNKWTYSPMRFWPAADDYLMQFIGYAPYGAVTILTENNTPTIDYTVPEAAADQKDLLICSTVQESAKRTPVSLHFDHICTAVKFVVGDIDGTIHSISLKGVRNKGTFDMTQTHKDENGKVVWNWDLDESEEAIADFTQMLEKDLGNAPAAGTEITLAPQTFMMLPQTLPGEAQIEVVYSDDDFGIKRTLTADIEGATWPIGKTVTYKISASKIEAERVFDIGISEQDISNYNNTVVATSGKYTVESYVMYNGEKIPKTWDWGFDENFSKEGCPEWLTFKKEKKTDADIETYTYTLRITDRTGVDIGHPQNEWLQARGEEGITDPYNLSHSEGNAGIIEETANCYIVNAAGTYSFPLVYGNAYKNGNNSAAYTFGGTSGSILHTFVNHDNQPITDPWIANNKNADGTTIKPYDATLLWQDAQGLIKSVKLVDENRTEVTSTSSVAADKYRIEFETADQNSICQGNAVIAVRNAAGQILWSWHIWVTDWNSGKGKNDGEELKTLYRGGNEYTMMSVNLGWCDGPLRAYEAREKVTIYFKQDKNDEVKTITIWQKDAVKVSHGNAPFYQWGRKDPMLPARGPNTRNSKTCYDINGSGVTLATANWDDRTTVIYKGILNPLTFCKNTHMENKYLNLWGASTSGSSNTAQSQNTVKTIYDPCPVGYKVPVSDMFRAFTSTGNEANPAKNTADDLLGEWNALLFGRYFPIGTDDRVFFSVTNYRNSGNGDIENVSDGWYWSAVPSGSGLHVPYSLTFNRSLVNPQAYTTMYRSAGAAIRPVCEKVQ